MYALAEVPALVIHDLDLVADGGLIVGREVKIVIEGEPGYSALYEVESPEVLVTPQWAAAVEKGRWPAQVRPFTTNRRHFMWERI